MGIEALDVTHAVSDIFTSIKDGDITKRAESSASQGPHSGDYVERAHKLSAEISIADLLRIVNRTHQEFLSDDVITKLGTERAKKKKGLFSTRNTDSSRRLLADALESTAQTKGERVSINDFTSEDSFPINHFLFNGNKYFK